MIKTMKKTLCTVVTIVSILIVTFIGVLSFSPKPLFFIAKLFPVESNITKPDNYQLIEENTKVERNIKYSSDSFNSLLDIYTPKEPKGKLPVILFIHGGGFFKGDKEMAKYFGPTLLDNRYAFISINYNLIPEVTIFEQIQQINEAVQFIRDNAEKYSLDINKINLAGSSAGGFLALQLLSTYNDEDYRKCLKLNKINTVHFNSILLYSAVYDLSEFQSYDGNLGMNFLISKMGWGLTGQKNWKKDKFLEEVLNLNNYVNESFPPLFITDGNTKTFTEQANKYVKLLESKSIYNETLFFNSGRNVGHGYQLNMKSSASKESIKHSLEFLNEYN